MTTLSRFVRGAAVACTSFRFFVPDPGQVSYCRSSSNLCERLESSLCVDLPGHFSFWIFGIPEADGLCRASFLTSGLYRLVWRDPKLDSGLGVALDPLNAE